MEGYRTWTGIVVMIIGWFGLGEYFDKTQVGQAIDVLTQFIGIVVAIYGNYKAHQKIKELKG